MKKPEIAVLQVRGTGIHFTLRGLVALCISLVVASAGVVYLAHLGVGLKLFERHGDAYSSEPPTEASPWGELVVQDVQIEQPEEYVAFEAMANRVAIWHLGTLTPGQARGLMAECGFRDTQIERALSPAMLIMTGTTTQIKPDDDLILSLSSEVRAKFYTAIAQNENNRYMRNPYHIPGRNAEDFFTGGGIGDDTVALVRKLVYPRRGNQYFSDVELVLNRIPTPAGRLKFFQALTRQTAVLPRLRVRPNTDIDKLLGYWGVAPGVRIKDMRPLLESLRRLPEGGTISLVYLLPSFARERLYTSPLPSKPGDPTQDCHWSTMNFFRETPDDRFADTAFTSKYIEENYYQVAKPSHYGDLVLILDKTGAAVHSAIHIADDIVFTKNGVNYAQPWILMRMKNLLAAYVVTDEPRVTAYRLKSL